MLPLHKRAPGGLVSPCGHSTRSPAEHTGPRPHSLSRPGDPLGATQMGTTNQCHLPRAKRPPGSSQSQGPREVAPTPAPRASVWNPGGGLRSLPHGLPFVFPSVSCSRLRACCGEKLAQEGVPCARHTQRCMPMNENAGWLWTQGCLEEGGKGREGSLASGAPHLPGRMAWGCGWGGPRGNSHGEGSGNQERMQAKVGAAQAARRLLAQPRGHVPPLQHPLTLTQGARPARPSLER